MNRDIAANNETDQGPLEGSLRRKRQIQAAGAIAAGLTLVAGGYLAHNLTSNGKTPQHQGPPEPSPTLFTPSPDLRMTPSPEPTETKIPDNK